MAERNLLMVKVLDDDDGSQQAGRDHADSAPPSALNMVSLGRFKDVTAALAHLNCHTDGDPDAFNTLHGPGVVLQLPMVGPDDPIMQVMVTLVDESIAWAVIERAVRATGWKLMDPKSGRVFRM